MLHAAARCSVIALLTLACACTSTTPDDLPPPCDLTQPAPYPDGSSYVGLHGNRENNNRIRCNGPDDAELGWQALEGMAIFQPISISADWGAVYAIAGRTEGCQLFALDAHSGEELWCLEGFTLGVAAGTPEVDVDGFLYVTDGYDLEEDGGAVMISYTAGGEERWRTSLEGLAEVGPAAPHRSPAGLHFTPGGYAATVTPDGVVVLLDRHSGGVAASFDIPAATGFVPPAAQALEMALPAVLMERLTRVIGPLTEEQLATILGASNGESGAYSDNTLAVAGGGQLLVIGGGPDEDNGALVALDLDEGGVSPELSLAWSMTFAGGSSTSPAVSPDGSWVVVGDGAGELLVADLAACNGNTDADPDAASCAPLWRYPLPGGPILASPGIDEEGVVYAWHTSPDPAHPDLFAVTGSAAGAELLWETGFANAGEPNRAWTSVTTVMNNLVVGTVTEMTQVMDAGLPMPIVIEAHHEMVAVDRYDGTVVWRAPAPDDAINSPAPGTDGSIYLPMMGILDLLSMGEEEVFQGGVVRYVAVD